MLDAIGAPPGFRGVFRSDPDACAVYSESAGVGRILPAAVARPADGDDVVTLRWAAEHGIALTPRGSGSSMANGALGAGVIVDLSRLRALGAVNPTSRMVTVEPGVTRDEVERAAGAHGLTLPVDPSSSAFATIGGMCATNAAGARTVRHGAMRRWVGGLDCVFADGTRAWVRRGLPVAAPVAAITRLLAEVAPTARTAGPTAFQMRDVRKQSSGYGVAEWLSSGDLVDLLVGSEGTLAIIVGVELMLAPKPGGVASLIAGFPDLEGAAAAAGRLAKNGASAVELLDKSFLEIAASGGDPLPVLLPPGLEAVLVVEAEEASEALAADRIRYLAGWCEAGGALFLETATDAERLARIWKLRHAASPILNKLAPKFQSMQVIEDGCVPPARFAEYVRGVRAALKSARFRGVIFGHAGDGHAHVNALVDVCEPGWRARLEGLIRETTQLLASLGGTAAGEHGDGRLRAPLLGKLWSADAVATFAAVKRAFDPDAILNPGVVIAEPNARALDDVKYDPALSPLPARARAALDHIVREKAWNADRLALLDEYPE